MAELLEMRGIVKQFPGSRALEGVDFTLRAGEIHALMGENGAGKSTLIKVLTGVYPRDAGTILLGGQPFNVRAPLEAQRRGISTVYQEVNLVPGLSVAENFFLGREPRILGMINWPAMRQRSRAALARLGVEIDVARALESFSVAIQQMAAIARAVDISARVLILDEPTSSLDEREVQELFAIMRKLAQQGMGIVFVTHFLNQVYAIADQITVLRNGKLVGSYPTAALPKLDLIGKMMGREAAQVEGVASGHRGTGETGSDETVLQARGLGRRGSVKPYDLEVKKGQVVGLAGLLGSGRTEAVRLLFGLDRADSGHLEMQGRRFRMRHPRMAMARGLGFCPEDRKVSGIVPELSVRENIILVLQSRRGWWRPIRRREQDRIVNDMIAALNIKTSSADTPIKFLSGGNQQKAILARWLAAEPRLLIVDEPTRGIDVGAKFEIARVMEALRQKGMSILFISSELEEVARICQRVIVMRDREKIGELAGTQISESAIMNFIAHGTPQAAGT